MTGTQRAIDKVPVELWIEIISIAIASERRYPTHIPYLWLDIRLVSRKFKAIAENVHVASAILRQTYIYIEIDCRCVQDGDCYPRPFLLPFDRISFDQRGSRGFWKFDPAINGYYGISLFSTGIGLNEDENYVWLESNNQPETSVFSSSRMVKYVAVTAPGSRDDMRLDLSMVSIEFDTERREVSFDWVTAFRRLCLAQKREYIRICLR